MKFVLIVAAVVAACWFGIKHSGIAVDSTPGAVVPAVFPKPPATTPPPPSAASTPVAAPVTTPPPKPAIEVQKPVVVAPKPATAVKVTAADPQMSRDVVLRPNNEFNDELFGVSATYPEGWTVRDAQRWGENNLENTVFFTSTTTASARPSMYYQNYPEGPPPREISEAYLRDVAQGKERSRSGNGTNDYRNVPGSFEYKELNGRPSLSYFAVGSRGDQVTGEYFVRILGEKGYVMFFVQGTPEGVQALMPEVNQMAATVRVP